MREGLRIGDWIAARPLGSGGMGNVWLARHEESRALGALKVLHADAGPDAEARFARERAVLATLTHPALVHLLDDGYEGDQPFLVMEYAPGESLEARLALGHPMRAARAVALFADLAHGLAQAHASGIQHRDIKAAHVVIRSDGWSSLVDFGIALKRGIPRVTSVGHVMGTYAYLAPEIVAGQPYDAEKADVYAWGQALCEALTGRARFRGLRQAPAKARWRAVTTEKLGAGPLDPGEPNADGVRQVVRDATAPDPAHRPTIAALAAALTLEAPAEVQRALVLRAQGERVSEDGIWSDVTARASHAPVRRSAASRVVVMGILVAVLLGVALAMAWWSTRWPTAFG